MFGIPKNSIKVSDAMWYPGTQKLECLAVSVAKLLMRQLFCSSHEWSSVYIYLGTNEACVRKQRRVARKQRGINT